MVTLNEVGTSIGVLILACFCITVNINNWASINFHLQSAQIIFIYYLYSGFYVAGIASVLWSTYINIKDKAPTRKPQPDQQTFFLTFTGMGLFFVPIMVMNILYLTDFAYCSAQYYYLSCDIRITFGYCVYHATMPLYYLIQLMYLVWTRYSRLNLGYRLLNRVAHYVMFGVNLAIIINKFCYEINIVTDDETTMNVTQRHNNYFACNTTNAGQAALQCIRSDTTIHTITKAMKKYVFSLEIQFTSLALSAIIGQLTSMTLVYEQGQRVRFVKIEHGVRIFKELVSSLHITKRTPEDTEHLQLLDTSEDRALPNLQESTSPNSILLLILALCLNCLEVIARVLQSKNFLQMFYFVIITNVVWLCSIVWANVYVLRHLRTYSVVAIPLPPSTMIILISSICAYILYFYRLISNFDSLFVGSDDWVILQNDTTLPNTELSLYLVTESAINILFLVSVIMQTFIVVRISRELVLRSCCVRLPGRVKSAIYYLICTNLSHWAWNSTCTTLMQNQVEERYYKPEVWHALLRVFVPGVMYFEFHAAMIQAEYMIAHWYSHQQYPPITTNTSETTGMSTQRTSSTLLTVTNTDDNPDSKDVQTKNDNQRPSSSAIRRATKTI